jgi:hypothetical protein
MARSLPEADIHSLLDVVVVSNGERLGRLTSSPCAVAR